MTWTRTDRLFPIVAWLWPSDFESAGTPAWQLERGSGREVVSCWPVRLYDMGGSTTAYLILHATRGNGNDGGAIMLAISPVPHYSVYAKEVLTHVPSQSHPRRYITSEDTWR